MSKGRTMSKETLIVKKDDINKAIFSVTDFQIAIESLATMLESVTDCRSEDTLPDCVSGSVIIMRSLARDVRQVEADMHGLFDVTRKPDRLEVVKEPQRGCQVTG